jgi:hypothetical protein
MSCHPPRTDDYYRARLQARCKVVPSGCWEWQGFRHPSGYGQIYLHGKKWSAHRASYRLHKGEIPAGMDVCHSCDNKPCCNPDHLWLGDQRANSLDVVSKGQHYALAKTHCPHGHAYAEHSYLHPTTGHRNCRECHRIRQRGKARNRGRRIVTHCKHGHPLSGDNLYVAPNGQKQCRACHRVRVVESARRRASPDSSVTP